jgi:hypothetical protein
MKITFKSIFNINITLVFLILLSNFYFFTDFFKISYFFILIILFLLLSFLTGNKFFYFENQRFFIFLIILNLLLIFQFIISPCNDGYLKGILSIFLLNSIFYFFYYIISSSSFNFDKFFVFIVYYLLFNCLFSLYQFFTITQRPYGLYFEPSFLAISCIPLCSILFFSNSSKNFYLAIFFLIFFLLFNYSATTFILTFITVSIVFLLYILKGKLSVLRLIYFIIPIIFILNSEYFYNDYLVKLNDIFIFGDSLNLSSLVYMYGFELLFYNSFISTGFGLGLNMMGCEILGNSLSYYGNQLFILDRVTDSGKLVNYNDGSFLFSKIISEFGFFGLIFIFLIYIYPICKLLLLIQCNYEPNYIYKFLFIFLAVSFSAIFVRGYGYFNSSFLLAIFFSMFFYLTINRKIKSPFDISSHR